MNSRVGVFVAVMVLCFGTSVAFQQGGGKSAKSEKSGKSGKSNKGGATGATGAGGADGSPGATGPGYSAFHDCVAPP